MRTGLTSSGLLSASTQVTTIPGQLFGATLVGGSATATLTIYDSASGATTAGTEICYIGALTGDCTPALFNHGVVANKGLYAVVSGTGAKFVLHYVQGA